MLMPKRTKHRKVHRGRRRGVAKGGTEVNFGEYGIQALEEAWITSRQIESARIAITRAVKRGGKVWINIFPDKPVTDPHGFRQGQRRVLGCGSQAGSGHVRTGRCRRGVGS